METIELKEEKVTVKKFRKNTWLQEGHDGEFRYTHCFESLVPLADSSGYPVTGLNQEEEAFLEKKLSLSPGTLSRYNKDYWGKFQIKIGKNGLVLDLSSPKDYLNYLVLTAHQQVAKSEIEKFDSPFAEYVITSDVQEAKASAKKVQSKRKAYKIFSAMSTEEMAGFLKVYGKRPGKNTTAEWLESEIGKIIEKDAKEFIAVSEDPAMQMKIFIDDCLVAGALTKNGTKYGLKGGDIIGYSLEDTIAYLKANENQEVYINLKSKLEVK